MTWLEIVGVVLAVCVVSLVVAMYKNYLKERDPTKRGIWADTWWWAVLGLIWDSFVFIYYWTYILGGVFIIVLLFIGMYQLGVIDGVSWMIRILWDTAVHATEDVGV